MDFGFSEKEESLRREVRNLIAGELPQGFLKTGVVPTEQIEDAAELALFKRLTARFAERGYLGWSWPEAYGGRGGTKLEHAIIAEEVYYQGGFGWPVVNYGHIGPTLLEIGTAEQKETHLPPMARGETFWVNGLSEPEAGSDLANISTTAVLDGDHYVINGQKRWGSEGRYADWIFFLARTVPDATRNKGISMFLTDLNTPGITRRDMISSAGYPLWVETHFDNVRIPLSNLLGEKDNGWGMAMTCLNSERTVIEHFVAGRRNLDVLTRYARETKRGGRYLIDDPLVRHRLAALTVRVRTGRLLCYRVIWMRDQGINPIHETSLNKLFVSDTTKMVADAAMSIMGRRGQLKKSSPRASWAAPLEIAYLTSGAWQLGAGSTEIQRDVIARFALKMPRS